jgi:MtN3 and saliva related transmembrane protein
VRGVRGEAELIGYLAAVGTTMSFVPQLVQVWRRKSARDISLGMFLFFSAGVFLWIVYGLATRTWPVVASNAVTFVLAISILVLKVRYDRLGTQTTG